jgi:hypothetical protein
MGGIALTVIVAVAELQRSIIKESQAGVAHARRQGKLWRGFVNTIKRDWRFIASCVLVAAVYYLWR